MTIDQRATDDQLLPREYCFHPLFHGSECESNSSMAEYCATPPFDRQQCRCACLSNRWAKDSFAARKKHPKRRGLVAYLRTGGTCLDIEQQRKVIDDFCQDNEYYVKATFVDHGKPGAGLQSAMEAVGSADGLIASDLNRFVEHPTDRFRDLRPFVHHYLCQSAKHLIAVEEGVDTGSTAGQANVLDLINRVKEPN
jgi:hypothetical protein